MPARKTYEQFIHEAKQKFGDNIDLSYVSNVDFDYSKTIYKFRCSKHNVIRETTCKVLMSKKYLCPECCKEIYRQTKHKGIEHKRHLSPISLSDLITYFEQYKENGIYLDIEKSTLEFAKAKYLSLSKSVICFHCSKHGDVYTALKALNKKIKKNSCPCSNCNKEKSNEKISKFYNNKMKDFIERAIQQHGNRYDYSLVKFEGKRKKIEIICPDHGSFFQYPSLHLRGEGCPICAKNGVFNCQKRLYEILKLNFSNLDILYEYRNKEIFKRQNLDIYIPELKLGIEYQGEQHFIEVPYLNDKRHSLEHRRELDIRKYKIAKEHDIEILYFTFNKRQFDYFTIYFNDIDDLIKEINARYLAKYKN